MIEFIDINKSFGPKNVLKGVSFSIYDGEVFFIIGQSGVGKSVLIKHVVGLLKPDHGTVLMDKQDITQLKEKEYYPIRKKCAMVFQNSTLFDSFNCIDNVAFPIQKHQKIKLKQARQLAHNYLKEVGMEEYAYNYPSTLGDGMKKRVAIARALAIKPSKILFDEPTTGLDPVSSRKIDKLIRKLSDKFKVTCVVVSHDLESIFSIADRIVMLYQGKIKLIGTKENFKNSSDPIISQFINGIAEGPMVI